MRMERIEKAELERLLIAILQPVLAKLIDKSEIVRIEPLLCSVAEATVMTGRSKRFIADGIARGLFAAKKSDGRTLLVVQSLKDYVAGLPAAKGTRNRRSRASAAGGKEKQDSRWAGPPRLVHHGIKPRKPISSASL